MGTVNRSERATRLTEVAVNEPYETVSESDDYGYAVRVAAYLRSEPLRFDDGDIVHDLALWVNANVDLVE